MQRSQDMQHFLAQALQEDVGRGDITSLAVIPHDAKDTFQFVAREPMVLCGSHILTLLAMMVDESLQVNVRAVDGETLQKGALIADITGSTRAILLMERVALNLLQHLSGIATHTAQLVQAVQGTGSRIVDTRKTLPGLRDMQKYAVRCGGGYNHRLGLDDGVLIKDNHIAVAGSITEAVQRARAVTPLLTKIEVECDRLEQVREAISVRADIIMLDNMDILTLSEAVGLCKAAHILTEASGNVSLENVRQVAETGVEIISCGKLTHSVRAVDIGLDAA